MEFVSEGCYELCGYENRDLEDQKVLWGKFTHPDEYERLCTTIENAVAESRPFEIEYRILTPDGDEKWVWERGRVVERIGNGEVYLEGFITDITDRKNAESARYKAEKELREQREQLAHVGRLNTLGEMATGIAHEINQPLTAISNYAQSALRFLNAENPKPERLHDALEKLITQAHRAGDVIERVQQLSRPHHAEHKIINCNEMIQDVSRLAEIDAHTRNMIIDLKLTGPLPAVMCDPVQIQQVILNLLRNGMEAMLDTTEKNGNRIIVTTGSVDCGVRISIIDSGSGIPADVARSLFGPFTSTKVKGMGMGLSISRSIIRAHSGQLEFKNNETCGACFYFTLPFAEAVKQ